MDKKNKIKLSLYDANKQIMSQEKPISKIKLKEIKTDLQKWFENNVKQYAMLLCREKYDFTTFNLCTDSAPSIATTELIEVLKNRGEILSIEKDPININCWEIWIRHCNEIFAYYLFDCEDFVIQC